MIGLMAKNGILIVEFANQLRDSGASVRDAVVDAAVLRLRPIVMTVISTILGAVPLVLATGAGAESRIAIGSVIVGGLGLALVFTLFLTPGALRAARRFLEAALGNRENARGGARGRQPLRLGRVHPDPKLPGILGSNRGQLILIAARSSGWGRRFPGDTFTVRLLGLPPMVFFTDVPRPDSWHRHRRRFARRARHDAGCG